METLGEGSALPASAEPAAGSGAAEARAGRDGRLALEREMAMALAGVGCWRLLMPAGVFDLDDRVTAMHGLDPGQHRLTMARWLERVHPHDQPAMAAALQSMLSGAGLPPEIRHRIVRPDGDIRWLRTRVVRVPPQAHDGATVLGATQDLTEREQGFRRLEAIFEQALSGIVLLDDALRIVNINPAAAALFGTHRPALLGQPIESWIEQRSARPSFKEHWHALIARGRTRGMVHLRASARAQTACADFVAVARIEPGVHLMVLSDATARLAAERQLREIASRQQEEFDAFRSEVARDVHDELGQTLGALMLEIGVHGRRTGSDVGHLLALLDDAVSTTRGLTRTLRPAAMDLGLPEALRELAATVSQRTELDVRVQTPSSIPDVPDSVVRGFYRIAQEALTNALKHSASDQAELILLLKPETGTAGVLQLFIVDHGRGFNPTSATGPGAGQGLGLIGMRERAIQIGAALDVTSEPGRGCSVGVSLELQPQPGDPPPAPASGAAR